MPTGVQALLRREYIMPSAIYVHCYAHKLNLVICEVSKSIPYLSEFHSIINKIYKYFHVSSVRNETFKNKNVQRQLRAFVFPDNSISSICTIKNGQKHDGIVVGCQLIQLLKITNL